MARLLLLTALVVLAACGSPAAAGRPDVQGSWRLVSGEAGGVPLAQPPGATATLVVEEDRLGGSAFCNTYSAGYRLDGAALSLTDLGSTEMGCAPPLMAAETAFLTALAAVDRMALDGAELVLAGGDATLRFAREAPEPDRALVGTRWVLDTLVDGGTASSVQGEPLLELADDGTARGSTGCRGWTGPWQRGGQVPALGPPTVEDVACPPGLARQDEQVTAVLAAGPAVAVDGDRLTLTAPDGRALGYRAG